jgi:hypothetical protein
VLGGVSVASCRACLSRGFALSLYKIMMYRINSKDRNDTNATLIFRSKGHDCICFKSCGVCMLISFKKTERGHAYSVLSLPWMLLNHCQALCRVH